MQELDKAYGKLLKTVGELQVRTSQIIFRVDRRASPSDIIELHRQLPELKNSLACGICKKLSWDILIPKCDDCIHVICKDCETLDLRSVCSKSDPCTVKELGKSHVFKLYVESYIYFCEFLLTDEHMVSCIMEASNIDPTVPWLDFVALLKESTALIRDPTIDIQDRIQEQEKDKKIEDNSPPESMLVRSESEEVECESTIENEHNSNNDSSILIRNRKEETMKQETHTSSASSSEDESKDDSESGSDYDEEILITSRTPIPTQRLFADENNPHQHGFKPSIFSTPVSYSLPSKWPDPNKILERAIGSRMSALDFLGLPKKPGVGVPPVFVPTCSSAKPISSSKIPPPFQSSTNNSKINFGKCIAKSSPIGPDLFRESVSPAATSTTVNNSPTNPHMGFFKLQPAAEPTKNLNVLDSEGEGSGKIPKVKVVPLANQLQQSKLKLHKGCRCGGNHAVGARGKAKLTCGGQRCPCYVEQKPCIGCKCHGCRNPHLADGKKLLQGINAVIDTKTNTTIQLPPRVDLFQSFNMVHGGPYYPIGPVGPLGNFVTYSTVQLPFSTTSP